MIWGIRISLRPKNWKKQYIDENYLLHLLNINNKNA